MSCEYVREHYAVPAEIGRRVVVGGKPGIIAADRGHYLGVNFDADKPGVICNCHPTSEVEYGEIGVVRKMTPGRQRYAAYLEVADCFESFKHYLQYRSRQAKEGRSAGFQVCRAQQSVDDLRAGRHESCSVGGECILDRDQ